MESIKQVASIAVSILIIQNGSASIQPFIQLSNGLISSMGHKVALVEGVDGAEDTGCWARSYAAILKVEGGDSNHPNDKGGLTSRGITIGAAGEDPTKLSDRRIKEIYRKQYWEASGANKLQWPLCLAVFNSYVNSGRKWKYDSKATVREQALEVMDKQKNYYLAIVKGDRTQRVFLKGWMNRDRTLRDIMDLP